MTGPYQQQYPQQPPGVPGGQTAIAVTTKFFWLAFIFFFIKPKIFLNGHEIAGVWGRNVIPVQPGQHHLHVYVPYFLPSKIGPADLAVPVQPGQTVELEYRAPLWAFSQGSLGPPPQKYNGLGIIIAIYAVVFGLICLCCLLTVISSSSS
jgi:hypothetical protein